jgi:Ca-activated chloride channel family protein
MKTLSVLSLLVAITVTLWAQAPAPAYPATSGPPPVGAKAQPPAQQAAAPDPDNGKTDDTSVTTIKKKVEEVNVIFTVTDKHGKFIKNLKQQDFRFLDDKKPPEALRDFRSETDLPLRVGLLVDASNSIAMRFRFEQEAAIEFLAQIVRPKSDLAFVIGFDTTAEVTQDFTDDTEKLSRGIHVLRPGGGTALYDAVYYACRDKLAKAPVKGPVRRAIILLSDGDDNQSRVTREEAIEMAQRAEVIIYAISTNTADMKGLPGDKVLERMAEATGGRAFFPFKIQDVANAFTEIQEELRSQYQVAYKPAEFVANGRYRSIEILADNKKYRVRARKGYFAPRE